MAKLDAPITFTLKVTVEGIADTPSDKGNYGMRGASVEVIDASVDADMIGAFVSGNGNSSNILLYFAPDGVKRPAPKAPVSLPVKGKAKAPAKGKAKAPAKGADATTNMNDMFAAFQAFMASQK